MLQVYSTVLAHGDEVEYDAMMKVVTQSPGSVFSSNVGIA